MRILVVGGAGFLGTRVVNRLNVAGHEVTTFDTARLDRSGYFTGDITRIETLWEGLRISRPEVVIQLAYLLGPESKQRPYLASLVNVTGMTNVFEASRLADVRRVVYASSVAIHGFQSSFGGAMVNEDSPVFPVGPYAAMKLFNEQLAQTFGDRYGMEMVGIRFSNLFGHGRTTGSSGPWSSGMVSLPAVGKPANIPVSPSYRASMLYVDDAAEYVARLSLVAAPDRAAYLTGGYGVTVAELVETTKKIIPSAETRFTGTTDDSGDAVPVYRIDNSRIVATTGHRLPTLETRIADHAGEARLPS